MILNKAGFIAAAFAAAIVLTGCAGKRDAAPPAGGEAAAAASTSQDRPGSVADFQNNVGDRVLFGYDRYDLDDAARRVLDRQAEWLAKFPSVTLALEGHADERGTREYNLALGARRAASVKDYLMSKGVNSSRLETISYGKERPVCQESSESCWGQNRRGASVIKGGATS
jgi:peptidoglycan-associated lipoprotein